MSFLFITLNISCHSLLACRVSVEKSADGNSLVCYLSCFPLVYLSLSLIFVSLITTYFGVFLLWFILLGTLCDSWIRLIISFPMFGKLSAFISSDISISSKYFLRSFLSLFSFQFSSVAQSCLTLCDPMNRNTSALPVHHQLPEFTQTPVHRVSEAIQPSHPLSSPSPPAPNPSQHQSLFQ